MSNKSLLLDNSSYIKFKLNSFLESIENGIYEVDCFYQISVGRGFKKNEVMLIIYKVGEYGINVNINVDTFELVSAKTQGKYNKEDTKSMLNLAYWLYIIKLQSVLKEVVSTLVTPEVETVETIVQSEQSETVITEAVIYSNEETQTCNVNFKYTLDETVFPSDSDFEVAVKQVNEGSITVEQIETNVNKQIISFYNSIYNHFSGSNLHSDDIIYRDSIHAYIENHFNSPMYWTFLSILKNNGLLGICGRGYTFDYIPMQSIETPITVDTINSNETTINKSYIAYNRQFPTYEEAYNYCIESDFDTDYIETVELSTVSNTQPEVYHLYNRTFDSYRDAYNYAITNRITLSMIISDNAPISNERLRALEWQYITAKYKMSYDDVIDFLSHLQSVPNNMYVEERINACKSLLQRHETIQANNKEREEKQRYQAEQIDTILSNMYANGMTKREIGSFTKYYYNNEEIYVWYSGITIEKMYNELTNVHNTYFTDNHTAYNSTEAV